MSDNITLQLKQKPIILQYTKQGIQGTMGPQGEAGKDGITWELSIVMSNAPDGTASIRLYKDGELCTDETHYAEIMSLAENGTAFITSDEWSQNITGSIQFGYTGTRALFVVIYEDSFKEKVLCSNSVNYGRSATVSIGEVTKGDEPSVTNTGTSTDAVWNIVLPKGDKGDTGDTGQTMEYDPDTETIVVTSAAGNLHALAYLDTLDYTSELLTNKPTLGELAAQNSIDYESDQITNRPALGDLSALDSVDYETQVENKPALGGMAEVDDAPNDGKMYVRQNGMWVAITLPEPDPDPEPDPEPENGNDESSSDETNGGE